MNGLLDKLVISVKFSFATHTVCDPEILTPPVHNRVIPRLHVLDNDMTSSMVPMVVINCTYCDVSVIKVFMKMFLNHRLFFVIFLLK